MEKEYQEYVDLIDKMQFDENYSFADDFLSDVREFYDINGYITENQMQGVLNVHDSIR